MQDCDPWGKGNNWGEPCNCFLSGGTFGLERMEDLESQSIVALLNWDRNWNPRNLKWLEFVGLSSREERSTQEKSSEIRIGIPLTLLTSKTGMHKVKFHETEHRTTRTCHGSHSSQKARNHSRLGHSHLSAFSGGSRGSRVDERLLYTHPNKSLKNKPRKHQIEAEVM